MFGGKEPQKIKMRMKYDEGSLEHVNQHLETLSYERFLLGKFYHLLINMFQVETGCMSLVGICYEAVQTQTERKHALKNNKTTERQ